MKYLLAISFMLACTCYAAAQQPADTVIVNMVGRSAITGDTALRKFNTRVQRLFYRNLRMPKIGDKFIEGDATVSFIVGSDGKTMKPELLSMTDSTLGKEALRVTKVLSDTRRIEPLYRNGEPVVTKVKISICFVTVETHLATEEKIKPKCGIFVIGYPVMH